MNNYLCMWRGKRIIVQAETSYKAQQIAATQWKIKKGWEIIVILADKPVNTASL